jgi:AcrR family transcriptional regulator
MPKRPDKAARIVDAALALAARGAWREAGLAAIGREAGLTLLDVYEEFRSKQAILAALRRRVDRAVLAVESEEGERPRDRLFDTLMRRLDALSPHKEAIRALAREAAGDPLGVLRHGPALARSMAWMLEASGVDTSGWRGAARSHLLMAVWVGTVRVWLADDTSDMVKTMAALDRRLRTCEDWLGVAPPAEASPVSASTSG